MACITPVEEYLSEIGRPHFSVIFGRRRINNEGIRFRKKGSAILYPGVQEQPWAIHYWYYERLCFLVQITLFIMHKFARL
jgi:hypothetical protein